MQEAIELFKLMKFNEIRGASAEGYENSILISRDYDREGEANRDKKTMCIYVNLLPGGLSLIEDFEQHYIILTNVETNEKFIQNLRSNRTHLSMGQLYFPNIPQGEYTVECKHMTKKAYLNSCLENGTTLMSYFFCLREGII